MAKALTIYVRKRVDGDRACRKSIPRRGNSSGDYEYSVLVKTVIRLPI